MANKATQKNHQKSKRVPSKKPESKKPTMPVIEFYKKTKAFLEKKAKAYGLDPEKDLDKYYRLTDTQATWYKQIDGEITRCFAQLVFHGQNATMISNFVKFNEKLEDLKVVCCNFNPIAFNKKWEKDSQIRALVKALRKHGIPRSGDKEVEPGAIMTRFAKLLIHGAAYLKDCKSKAGLIEALKRSPKRKRPTDDMAEGASCINNFMSAMGKGSGFSVALTCDFLKELELDDGESFDYLAKPDVHIQDVLCHYYGLEEDYYARGKKRAFECLKDFQDLVENINAELKNRGEKEITAYKLDRMIWLCCTGRFFLDHNGREKSVFLREISGKKH
jgi:hypothetical protein